MSDEKLFNGHLVRLMIKNRYYTDEGLATVSTFSLEDPDLAELSAGINLTTFPSYNDFVGQKTLVRDGDLATVIHYVGRPRLINSGAMWSSYDVYEIFVRGTFCNVFRYNFETLPEAVDTQSLSEV